MKRVWEKIVEGILTCSGFVTSITILLIVVFLFAEALGLFNKKVIEEGYVLAVNKANPVQELSAAQIKDVFDEEITNWKELGGPDAEVKVFRLEDITSYFSEEELGAGYEKAPRCIGEIVAGIPGIIAFVTSKFIEKDFPGHLLKDESISFDEVFDAATKAGLSSFGKSLFEEARKYGVKVTTIHPDMTDTNLYRDADFTCGEEPESYLLPDEVAKAVAYVLDQREGMVVPEITLRPQLHRIARK